VTLTAGEQLASSVSWQAAIRETRQEVGLALSLDRIQVVGVMYQRSNEERVDFFLAYQLGGETPQNAEAEKKCSELVWAKVSELLNDTIPYVRVAIQNFAKGQWFSSVRLGIGSRLVTCCSGASGRDVRAAVAERERLAGRQSSEHEPSSGGGYGRIRPSEP